MKRLGIFLLLFLPTLVFSQSLRFFPTNWWRGMRNNKVQVLLQSSDTVLNSCQVSIKANDVKITSVHHFPNHKYLAIDLLIGAAAPAQQVVFCFSTPEKKTFTANWPLLDRRPGRGTKFAQGVQSSDFIYLIMPDRFSDGDTTNDRVKGMLDQSLSRDSLYYRHGGDLKGITTHLDYLKDLGVTTLWLTPVMTNDDPDRTEHGYAITDQYGIDPRLGGVASYLNLSDSLHAKGMKLIEDMVYNHTGIKHIFFLDPPSRDFFHRMDGPYMQTSSRDQPLYDPYGSDSDRIRMQDGWFTTEMPDWNQKNPYVANFLIENAIWTVETYGVDGFRIDTYIYNDLDFMNRCNAALKNEYPLISMFGEAWVGSVVGQSYFAANNIKTSFKSNLDGVADFQALFSGLQPALTEPQSWDGGIMRLYTTLSQDFLYLHPERNVIFLDNHDLSRFFSVVGEHYAKMKIGLGWLFTTRGIPSLYYGTEILMKGIKNPDGWVRMDFPGGWQGDQINAFTAKGLTAQQLEAQQLVKRLANFRKKSSALKTGKLMQYIPSSGLYVYFRYNKSQTIMCIINTDTVSREIKLSDYPERTNGFHSGLEITTSQVLPSVFQIDPWSIKILELSSSER